MVKSSINGPFSMAMLNNQRLLSCWLVVVFDHLGACISAKLLNLRQSRIPERCHTVLLDLCESNRSLFLNIHPSTGIYIYIIYIYNMCVCVSICPYMNIYIYTHKCTHPTLYLQWFFFYSILRSKHIWIIGIWRITHPIFIHHVLGKLPETGRYTVICP